MTASRPTILRCRPRVGPARLPQSAARRAVYFPRHPITLPAVKPGANAAALMSAAGNRRGGLPFTVVLREGHIRLTHERGLTGANLKALRLAGSTGEAKP